MKEIANLIKLDFTSVKRKIIIPFISIILFVFALELFTLPYVMCLCVMPFIGDFVQPVFSVLPVSCSKTASEIFWKISFSVPWTQPAKA